MTDDRRARRDLARLASRLLAVEVDAALLARLRATPELLDPALAGLDDARAIEELAVEYCRLFIGPQPVCPPYASAYSGGRRLGGRAESDLRGFLAAHDLELRVRREVALLGSDHLAVHLAVLAHLYDRPADRRTRDVIAELVERHLTPWARDLAAVLVARSRLRPYSTAGAVLGGLLDRSE